MSELYATSLQLVHVGGGSAFDVAGERCLSWLRRRVPGVPDDLAGVARDGAQASAQLGHATAQWEMIEAADIRAARFRLAHADEDDKNIEWITVISVSERGPNTRLTLRLHRRASVHMLRPTSVTVRPPNVVLELTKTPLVAYAGDLELTAGARMLPPSGVRDFVEDVLKADRRALPVVVVASAGGRSVADPLARALSGLAAVVLLDGPESDDLLREELGPQSVPDGGLRLYWPGFGQAQLRPLRNPYWTARQSRSRSRDGRLRAEHQLVSMIAPISADGVPVDQELMVARRAWLSEGLERHRAAVDAQREKRRREREREREARRAARPVQEATLEEIAGLNARVEELENDLSEAQAEASEAQVEADHAKERELATIEEAVGISEEHKALSEQLAAVRAENATLKDNFAAIRDFQEEEEVDLPATRPTVETWEEFREHISDLAGPGFCITETAAACANGKNRYPYPKQMWAALCGLERLGRTYNELGAQIGTRFEDWALAEAGLQVALHDKSYAASSLFEFEGNTYSREPHVKVDDAKSPNEVGRIYFALDNEGQRIIVDWFGTKPDRPTN